MTASLVLTSRSRRELEPWRRSLLIALLFEGGVFLLALAGGWLLGHPPLARLRLSPGALLWSLPATLPPLLFLLLCLRLQWKPMKGLVDEMRSAALSIFDGCRLHHFVFVSLLAGVGEEAFFRGLVQVAVAERSDPWSGLAAASIFFGLLHFITPAYALIAGLMGFYLGGLFLFSDNLLIPIVVHVLYDLVGLAKLVPRAGAGGSAPPLVEDGSGSRSSAG